MNDTIKQKLIAAMKEYGLAKYRPDNPFTLSSGMKSPWYFDVKSALMFDPTKELVEEELNHAIIRPDNVVVGGPANAAYLLVSMVRGVDRRFVMRKGEKDHGIVGKIDGWPPNEGDDVVLVEDVITTGGSLLPTIRYVEDRGAILKEIIVVVDRNENDQLGKYRELVSPLTTKEDFLDQIKWDECPKIKGEDVEEIKVKQE